MSGGGEPPWLQGPALEVVGRIVGSHRLAFGAPLLAGVEPWFPLRLVAQEVFAADQVVLAHDGSADPRLIYANAAALQLWGRGWGEMIGLPSRLTAVDPAGWGGPGVGAGGGVRELVVVAGR